MKTIILLVLISITTFAGRTYTDKIMAKVNGHIITNYEIQELSYREEMRLSQIFKGPTLNKEYLSCVHAPWIC